MQELKPRLYGYQRRFLEDRGRFRAWDAARQVGKSFTLGLDALTAAHARKGDVLLLSASQRQSDELMRKVEMHQRYMEAAGEAADGLVSYVTRRSDSGLELDNGSRVICLPASPDTIRGFSGDVYLDEFAFHSDGKEILGAALPMASRGHRLTVASSRRRGRGAWDEVLENSAYSKHRTTIHEAVADGLSVDVEGLRLALRDPEAWALEFEASTSMRRLRT